jgi:hypothetical protein
MNTNDVTTFIESQTARIRQLECNVAALTEELETERAKELVNPKYRGIEFWICKLDPGYTLTTNHYYGYHLRQSAHPFHNEGGGAYATKHEATKAAFARIETLTVDR